MPQHIIIGLFESTDTCRATLAEIVHPVLKQFNLLNKVILCVKNEGSNLSILEKALQSIVTCNVLGLDFPYVGSCFGHAMSEACKYGTSKKNIYPTMKLVSLKRMQARLRSCITWTKKSSVYISRVTFFT